MQTDAYHMATGESERLERSAAAEYIGLKPRTLAIWASKAHRRANGGKTPIPFYKVGSRVYYMRADLDAFLEGCRVE